MTEAKSWINQASKKFPSQICMNHQRNSILYPSLLFTVLELLIECILVIFCKHFPLTKFPPVNNFIVKRKVDGFILIAINLIKLRVFVYSCTRTTRTRSNSTSVMFIIYDRAVLIYITNRVWFLRSQCRFILVKKTCLWLEKLKIVTMWQLILFDCSELERKTLVLSTKAKMICGFDCSYSTESCIRIMTTLGAAF